MSTAKPQTGARDLTDCEREEVRAVLPEHLGLECIFYTYLKSKTMHLRERVYVTVETEGLEFRPESREHFPTWALLRRQKRAGGVAYGAGRELEVSFVCYAPKDSGAAAEAAEAIGDGLEYLRGVAGRTEWSRLMFSLRHNAPTEVVEQDPRNPPPYRPPAKAFDEGSTT